MRKTRSTPLGIAAALLCIVFGSGPAAGAEPRPDFKVSRPVSPDFNLSFELAPAEGQDFLVAVGGEEGYAFARFSPRGTATLGASVPGTKTGEASARLPAAPKDAAAGYVLKFRSSAARWLVLTDGREELARVRLPELKGPPSLAFAGGGSARVRSIQKIDRSEPVLFSDDFTRQGAALGAWKPDGRCAPGVWRVNADPHPDTSASPFALESAACDRPALIRAGEAFWDDCRVRAAVNVLESPGAAGLAFDLSEDGGGYLLRLAVEGAASGGAGRAELVRLAAGGAGEEVLASKALAGSPRSWYELELASSGMALRASVDGTELAVLPGRRDLVGGRVGLWSSGAAPARFDDVRVEALELAPEEFLKGGPEWALAARRWWLAPPSLPAYFRNDRTMQSWARIEDEYALAGGGYWHRAALCGDQEIAWKSPNGARLASGQLILALAADGQDFNSGYRLVADLGPAAGGDALLTLFEKDRRAAGAVVPLGGAGLGSLGFSRECGRLLARVGSRTVLSTPDTLRIASGRAGARALGGWRLDREALSTSGAGLLDEVFARAPVEWRMISGDWEVASRWKCDPEYTWMLGRARKQLARMDLKRPVNGDFQLDLHFAVGMAERPGPFYDAPVNLTVTLSPDPADPAAGYAFAFGGPDEPSRILRAGKPVASGDVLLRTTRRSPDGGFLHSHWYGLRIVRQGARLAFWGDGEKLAEFADPAPVAGAANLAILTRGDNGAVVSRVRIEAAAPLGARRSPFDAKAPATLAAPAALPGELAAFRNRDGTNGAMLAADPKGGRLRLVTPEAGGTFAAACSPAGGIDLARTGWLEFDWRTSPGARVNLYLVRDGVFYRARLTGPAARPGGRYNIRHLGDAAGARSGSAEPQHFRLDLASALAAAAPELPDRRIEEIRIGNYEVEDAALLEGFTGNRAGDWVELSGWRLAAAPGADLGVALVSNAQVRARGPLPPRLIEPAPLDFDDFERDLGGWESFGGIDGAQLVRDDSKPAPDGGRWCLLAENQRCGGTMGSTARARSLDVRRYPLLSFDYCIEPNTTINLLLYTARGRHEIEMTDPDGGAIRIGSVPGARDDGKWHRATVDLQAVLANRGATIVRNLGFADLGPGLSTTATIYRIDNWTLLPAVNGARPLRFRWTSADGSPVAGSSAVLDRDPATQPVERVTAERPELVQAGGLAEGLWYLHVRCRDAAGKWGPAAHWPVKIVRYDDAAAPTVASVRPGAGEKACPERLEVIFAEDGSGLSPHDVEVEIGSRRFRPGQPGVVFYPAEKRMTVELADLDGRLLVAPGEIRCRVTAADYAGNRAERPFEWSWTLDMANDAGAPVAPRTIYVPSERLVFEDFEAGQGEFAEWRRGTCYREDVRTRAEGGSGRSYLNIGARRWHDNNNEAQFYPHPLDPARWSLLAFDYRMRQDTGLSFMIQIANDWHYFSFGSGGWRSRGREGELGRAVVDGAWHRAEIDLRKLRGSVPPGPDGALPVLQNLLVTFGTQEGMDLDNFVLGDPRSRSAEFRWDAPAAPSGIAGYSWLLDGRPDTVPPEKTAGLERRATFRDLAPGRHWFHVRAVNGAGRWGGAAHVPFTVEP